MNILTPEQQAAVDAPGELVVCVAGPGSGKTRTLVARVANDIRTGRAAPETTAVITFTNAAAKELRRRISDEGVTPPAYIGTLHGWCLQFLNQGRAAPLTVLDEGAAEAFAKFVIEDGMFKTTASKLADAIAGTGQGVADTYSQQLALAVAAYRKFLNSEGAIDYNLILSNALEKMATMDPGVRALYVDEFQDTAPIDLRIYDAMRLALFFVVGDPDQAIYGFRGGDVAGLLSLITRPGASVRYLQDCFRCPKQICEAANKLIAHNTLRAPKEMRSLAPADGRGMFFRFETEIEERAWLVESVREVLGKGTPPQEVAVLVRYNGERERIVEAFKAANIPLAGAKPEEPKDWRLAVAALNLIATPTNFMAGVAYHTARGASIGEALSKCRELRSRGESYGPAQFAPPYSFQAALEAAGMSLESRIRILELAAALDAQTPLATAYAIREAGRAEGATGVTVTTYHGAKGLEWDTVFLPALDDATTPGKKNGIAVEEERRLAFVAVTRTKNEVLTSSAGTRTAYFGPAKAEDTGGPSRFILEMAAIAPV